MKKTDLTWRMRPEDQGQMIEVSYAMDWENEQLYRRTYCRSDMFEEIEVAEVCGGDFFPEDERLPDHGKFRKASVS